MKLSCGHEEFADGYCGEMSCPKYYMKDRYYERGISSP